MRSPRDSLKAWADQYKAFAPVQASLVVIGSVSSMTLYYFTKQSHWLKHSILLGSIFPFTMMVIKPLANDKLFELHDEVEDNYVSKKHDFQISDLLTFWNQLHLVRTVSAGFSLFVVLKHFIR